MMISFKSIETKTRTLLKNYGKYDVAVDVFSLITDLEIELIFESLPVGTSGLISIDDVQTKILVNSEHHPNRQRFTAAHELGHYVLHRDLRNMFLDGSFSKGIPGISDTTKQKMTFHRNEVSHSGDNTIEIEANRFAAALIMPEELVYAQIDALGIDVSDEFDVKRLAKKFKVSEQAMTHRMSRLGMSYM